MSRNKVGNEVLLFTGLFGVLFKHGTKALISANARFHHFVQWTIFGVLGSNFQIATHMMGDQLLNILR